MELVAHRGANWHFPENSLPAFRRALQDGANILEMDVQCTKDNQVVVCHDDIWRGKKIAKTAYEALEKGLPLLKEVIEAFPNSKLNVDIKAPDIRAVYLTVDIIRNAHAENRVCLASFHWEVHRWLKDIQYEGERGLSWQQIIMIFFLPRFTLETINWHKRRVQVPLGYGLIRFDSAYFIKKCHQLRLPVDYWVINNLEIAQKLKKLSADRIMTDDPATLAPLGSA
ncbi:MAG: hypothetical protein JKY15_05635 [Deltaproteobacteria bacterium]|nr:hypothetical protein [Deltaproteobacteria bacterium]